MGQSIQAPYSNSYTFADLGAPQGVPTNYGGVAFEVGEPDTLYIGGQATRSLGAVYRIQLSRGRARAHHGVLGSGDQARRRP